jgi:hypothetical protein
MVFEIDEYVNIFYILCMNVHDIKIATPSVSYNGSYFAFLTDLISYFQMKEYQHLQEIKIALDMEIAVFRRLIESEEDRLDMNDSRDRGGLSHGSSNEAITVERKSESSFQRKVTVSQTQL